MLLECHCPSPDNMLHDFASLNEGFQKKLEDCRPGKALICHQSMVLLGAITLSPLELSTERSNHRFVIPCILQTLPHEHYFRTSCRMLGKLSRLQQSSAECVAIEKEMSLYLDWSNLSSKGSPVACGGTI